MNWYKKAQQKGLTANDIYWAVDDIILNDILTEEDMDSLITNNLDQIFANKLQGSESLPKAAQVKTKLRSRSVPMSNIVPQPPSSEDINEELEKQKKLIDLGAKITYKKIAQELNSTEKEVRMVCKENNIDIEDAARERRQYIDNIIIDFVESLPKNITKTHEIYNLFSQKYQHNLKHSKLNRLFHYNNLIANLRNKPENIYQAFSSFVKNENTNSKQNIETLIETGKYIRILDTFLNRWGHRWGFETPIAKDLIKKFVMTKIQLRDKFVREKELGNFFNQTGVSTNNNRKLFKMIEKGLSPEDISRETGIDINQIKHFYELYQTKRTAPVLDETHPSYFLNTNENYNELV
jgi:hypothetical protein